ncbi:helix-turn-helix transcriptional regulator [Kitasatospora sp. NPDC048722]|uniref:helix-turn-helix transcriptional regulator n=1 Tax=Kitasatospora sp. NPDC048722 TaxID=3155639 RepID=UPI0033C6C83F
MGSDIGRRVAYWRNRRNMTQQQLAARMRRSLRWIEALEGGHRQADPQLSVLESAARALGVPIERLISDDPGRDCIDATELDALRAVLQRYDVVTGAADPDPSEPAPVADLLARYAHGRLAFQAGHFGALGRLVPDLLVDATRAAARHDGDERLGAYRVLSLTYGLTEAAAAKYGAGDVALVAAHRAVLMGERCGDPVVMASAARQLADAMTHGGQGEAAVAVALGAADRLEADLLAAGPDGLSCLGMLYLKAAMAQSGAAELGDDRLALAVPGLLDQADEHAERLGYDGNHMWTAFGPTNAAIHRVAAQVQLSAGAEAVATAAAIPAPARAALPRERRAHHLVDLARGHLQAGQRTEAVDALLAAESEAQQEVRCRPRTRALIEDLRTLGAGSAEGRLRALAGRCGLPG